MRLGMSATAPFLHAVPPHADVPEKSMNGEDREERRSGVERRTTSPLANPMLWISICGVLLTVCGLLLTIALNILSGIDKHLSTIDANTQAIVISTTKQGTEIDVLKDQMKDLQRQVDGNEKTQRDYNYNLSTRLGKVEVQTGMKSGGIP